jgi:protein-disulfide isomerase
MKRYLPFLILIAVALMTVGAGTILYRAKVRSQPAATAAGTTTAKPEEPGPGSLHAEGSPQAPVTLEIYGDFQCPPCASTSAVISKLQEENGPRLRVVFREFPLMMHQHAIKAAMAAEAAGLQGHFWEMHDMLYKYQAVWSKVTDPSRFFTAYAAALGLDVGRFNADSTSEQLRARIRSEGEAGVARGVKNTPTLFINGGLLPPPFDQDRLQSAIDAAVAGKNKS